MLTDEIRGVSTYIFGHGITLQISLIVANHENIQQT